MIVEVVEDLIVAFQYGDDEGLEGEQPVFSTSVLCKFNFGIFSQN